MKKLITIIIVFILISIPGNSIFGLTYRLPFADNHNLKFTQTWHQHGFYYTLSNSSYIWVSGADYAIDIQDSSADNSTIIAPEAGKVKYKEDCAKSTNLVIDAGGYEFQMYHLDKNNMSVSIGSNLTKGQAIGKLYTGKYSDSCGSSEGSHLHLRFQTKQGSNDTNRKYLSGYYFDEYDGTASASGDSGCIMHRDSTTYCLAGYGVTGDLTTFTANEPAVLVSSCSGANVTISNQTISGPYNCGANTSIKINPTTTLSSATGTITLHVP